MLGLPSTWMGDRLGTAGVVGFTFFFSFSLNQQLTFFFCIIFCMPKYLHSNIFAAHSLVTGFKISCTQMHKGAFFACSNTIWMSDCLWEQQVFYFFWCICGVVVLAHWFFLNFLSANFIRWATPLSLPTTWSIHYPSGAVSADSVRALPGVTLPS